jgi:hemolysin III
MLKLSPPKKACEISGQLPLEEVINYLTHGLGAFLSAIGLLALIATTYLYNDAWYVFSCTVYGSTLLLLYTASTCYHASRNPAWKKALKIVDHACIYLLIAGSYTPFTLGPLRGVWGWTLFAIVWTFALVGITLKILYNDRSERICVLIYLVMGWIALVAIVPLMDALSFTALCWMFAGGIAYSSGTIFYLWETLSFSHSIWHCFVLLGSVCHYICIMFYVIP